MPKPAATPTPRAYSLVRSEQNWSEYIVPLKRDQPSWYASFGGEIRENNESIGNDLWGKAPYENSYVLQRYLLIADVHLGERLRVFTELKSNEESGRTGGPRPIDKDNLDFLALFLQTQLGPSSSSTTVRVGREELSLGSGRLVAPREGPNVRQSFTGLQVSGDVGAVHLDALAVRPNEDNPGAFDDFASPATSLWGLYASTKPEGSKPEFDAYYLGIQRDAYTIARGSGRELRDSIGVRVMKPFLLHARGLDYDDEFIWQFGTFAGHPIGAWSASTETGWHLGPSPRSPHVLLNADIASGDDPKSTTVGTFDPYFPIGNYFGVLATTGPGPVNFVDVHPAVSTALGPVTLTADWLWYWRQRVTDGLYSVPGKLLREPSGSLAHFVGERPGIEAKWQINEHAYVQGDYGVFSAGPYIHESGPAMPLIYRLISFGYKI